MYLKPAYYQYQLYRYENGLMEVVDEDNYLKKFRCGQIHWINRQTGQEENIFKALSEKHAAKRHLTKWRKDKGILV